MSMRMASFLAGFGGGYLKADRQGREDERQAKMDKITTDRADREAADWKKKDDYETGLANAGKTVAAEQANDVLLDENGNTMPAVPKFRTSDGQRFETMADATAATEKLNTPDAISARQAQFMQANGKPLDALQMTNAVTQAKLNKLGLTKAEGEHADQEFNRNMLKTLDANPDWTVGASEILTNANTNGLKGVKVSARPSADGKTVDFVGIGEDGVEKKLKTLPNNAQGKADFLQTVGRASLESKINYVVDRAKGDQTQSNWQQTFEFNRKKEESDTQYKNRVLNFQANQDARAAETHKVAMADAKIPAAVKQTAATLAKEMDSVSTAINKSMADNTFDPNSTNAKSLLERQALLGIQYRNLMQPHMPAAKGQPATDPLDMNKPAQVADNGGKQPPVSMQTVAPATAPPATPAAPAATPKAPTTVLEALEPSGNASLIALSKPKAQAIEGLVVQLKQQQALMVEAAKSNPQTAIAQSQKVQEIRNLINKQVENMNPAQAALVIKAAGL